MSFDFREAGAPKPHVLDDDEEDELELPPLDGALDEDGAADAEIDDEIGIDEEPGGDDAVASDLDLGSTLDIEEEPSDQDGDAPGAAFDIGAIAEVIASLDEGERGSDESGLALDSEDESPFDAEANDDAGAGTGEDPAGFIDESALPPLDDEARGVGAGSGIGDAAGLLAEVAKEHGTWRLADGIGARVPCWLVAVSAEYVVAAGPTVLIARDGGRVSKVAGPGIDAAALAASEEAIFAVARRGALLASVDGGESWATGSVPWPAARGSIAIAATPGRLWIRDAASLWSVRWSRRSRPEAPLLVRSEGVRAIATTAATLVVLAQRDADLVAERLRGDDEAPPAHVMPAQVSAALGDASPVMAVSASGLAIALLARGVLHVSHDGGKSYFRARAASAIAVAFAGNDDDAPVILLTSPLSGAPDRRGALVLAEALPSGDVVHVANVPGGAVSGRAALAWDPAREVLWVACAAGLVAFERSAQH